jgi:HlyD family secretion protein
MRPVARRGSRGLSALPLPEGERVGVRGLQILDRPEPLTPPLSLWEREQAQPAAKASIATNAGGVLFALGFALFLALFLAGCDQGKDPTFQGWIEADLIFVAPDEMGRVETLAVQEGDQVAAGAPLFSVDADLQKADLQVQEATLKNAQQAYDRARDLAKALAGTQKALEDAEAALRTAQARLNAAQTRLDRRKVASPVTGSVEQIYFRVGEVVPQGKPVVALLPPDNLKVRFFVNEGMLPQLKLGDPVKIQCDGCTGDLGAKVSFIARSAEYTPPVIYSQEERAKLVFMVEARPQRPDRLRVGQPVSVALAPAEAAQ